MSKKPFVSVNLGLSYENCPESYAPCITSEKWDTVNNDVPIHKLALDVVVTMFLFFAGTVAGGNIEMVESAWSEFLRLANRVEWSGNIDEE